MKKFLDDTIIDSWFKGDITYNNLSNKKYYLYDYISSNDKMMIITEQFQALIDKIHENGGGLLVVDRGAYKTGAIFLRQGVDLYIAFDGEIIGSDDILDYPVMDTRIEGECCKYFPALINADSMDRVYIGGTGKINGNGLRSWKLFWQRLSWNPKLTNKDVERPRLIYISNCSNIEINGLELKDSHFWTTHFYKCNKIRLYDLKILSPYEPIKAPSTDAIDIDYCSDVHIKGCYISVNDDAIALKGGKGPYADMDPNNGLNERIIIENCEFGFCHSCLTCGSESIYSKNIIMRDCIVNGAKNLLWLKMRPDTPQHYEYILIDGIKGSSNVLLFCRPWAQFFDLKGRKDIPLSYANNIIFKNLDISCSILINAKRDNSQYLLSDFALIDSKIKVKRTSSTDDLFTFSNVIIEYENNN